MKQKWQVDNMPTTPVLGATYPTPLDPATADIWGDIVNALFLVFDGEFGTRTVDQNFADKILSRPILRDYGEDWQAVTSTAGAVSINVATANHASLALSENVTSFGFTNFSPTGNISASIVRVIQDVTPRTIVWTSPIDWGDAGAPTLTTVSGGVDTFLFETFDAGSTIYAYVRGQGF